MMKELSKAKRLLLWRDPKTGRYYLRVKLSGGGEKKYSLGTKLETEAKPILAKIKERLEEVGNGRKTSSLSFSEFKKTYLDYIKTTREPGTLQSYRAFLNAFERFLEARFGKAELHQVTPKTIDEFVTYLSSKGNRKTTINRHLRELKAAFSKAVKWDLLGKNPLKRWSF